MTCLEDTQLASLEAGTLESAAETEARAHLKGCERCDARREDLVGTVRLLGGIDAAEIAPPPALWEAVAARIEGRPAPGTAVTIACAFCKGKLARMGAVYCAACIAPHHEDCWDEHGKCAACSAREHVKASVTVKPARRRQPGWLVVVAGALAGAGAVAALQGRAGTPTPPPSVAQVASSATPVASTTPPEPGPTPPLSPEAQDEALLRHAILGGVEIDVGKLVPLCNRLVASLGPTSPPSEVDLLARIALRLATDQSYDREAEMAYTRVLMLAPQSFAARLARAKTEAYRGGDSNLKIAREEYDRLVALRPDDLAVALERIEVVASLDAAEGRAELDRLLARSLDPKSRRAALRRRARVLSKLGEDRLSVADRRTIFETNIPESVDIADFVAALRRLEGRAAVVRFLDEAIVRHPDRARLWMERGALREEVLDYEGALEDFARAEKLEPQTSHPSWTRLLALSCNPEDIADELERRAGRPLTLGDLTADVAAERSRLQREIDLHVNTPTNLDWALLELARGRVSSAKSTLDRQVDQKDPSYTAHMAILGLATLWSDGVLKANCEGARRYFESALASCRTHPLALAGLAMTYDRLGDPLRARSVFRKAREAQGASPDAEEAADFALGLELAARARLGARERDRVLARRAFARVIYRNPLSARAYYERARLALDAGRWDSAVTDAKEALRADPYFLEAFALVLRLNGRDLPERPDPKTLRPLNVRDPAAFKDALNEARSKVEGGAEYVDLLVAANRVESSHDVKLLLGRAVEVSDEIAPVLSGGRVALDRLEHAAAVLTAAYSSKVDAEVVAAAKRFAERGRELIAEARVLLDVARDPWTAIERFETGRVLESIFSQAKNIEEYRAQRAEIEELRRRCRAALSQVERR